MANYNLYHLTKHQAKQFLKQFFRLFQMIDKANGKISNELDTELNRLLNWLVQNNYWDQEKRIDHVIFVFFLDKEDREIKNLDISSVEGFIKRHILLTKMNGPVFTMWPIYTGSTVFHINKNLEQYFATISFSKDDIISFDIMEEADEDQLHQAILIKGMELIPDSFKINYNHEENKRVRKHTFYFSKEMREDLLLKLALSYLESHHYQAVLSIFPKRSNIESIENLVELYEHINYLSFSYGGNSQQERDDIALFEHAIYTAKKHGHYAYLQSINEMKGLMKEEQIPFIIFLYHQMIRYFEEQNYIDYVVRHYRLLEELLLFALGWDIDKEGFLYKRQKNAWDNLLTKDKKTFRHLVHELVEMTKNKQEYEALKNYVEDDNVKELIEMRHEGIGGHGFDDITDDEISIVYKDKDYNHQLYHIIKNLGIPLGISYYDILDHLIILEVEEYIKKKQ